VKDHVGLRLPSVTAGLVRGGALVWAGGCGGVDGTVPGCDVQYRCGSITKTFVAVAVLRLRDAGRVDLCDPVGRHIDAGAAAGLTVGQLLSHTSGVRAETAGPWWERTAGVPLRALIDESPGPDGRRLRPGRMHIPISATPCSGSSSPGSAARAGMRWSRPSCSRRWA
jgi:CubicO group peptidase (beta-lactamase class C family)